MAWDSVPWFVGGGAQHSPEIARVLAYAAFGGAEGIVGPGDLVVKEQAVPDGTVQVLPGACSILNRASAQEYQAYVGRLPSADTVSISPTDATGGRSDLIVARIEDPWLAGEPWADPVDPTTGPYVFTRVIPNVPAGTTSLQEVNPGESGIALARIDLPASTGTVTQALITDVRALPRARRESRLYVHNQASADNLLGTTWENWPGEAAFDVEVPEWAVRVQIAGTFAGFKVSEPNGNGGNVLGDFRASLGSLTTQVTRFNYSSPPRLGKHDAGMTAVGDDLLVPESMRGTVQTLRPQGQKRSGASDLYTDADQVTFFQVEFYEAPDA